MIIEVITEPGIVGGQILRIHVQQHLGLQDNGTPIYVAAENVPNGNFASTCLDDDFNERLASLRIEGRTVVDKLVAPEDAPRVILRRGGS